MTYASVCPVRPHPHGYMAHVLYQVSRELRSTARRPIGELPESVRGPEDDFFAEGGRGRRAMRGYRGVTPLRGEAPWW